MSPATDDTMGRRRFLLHRDKAVELALESIRRAPAAGWETFSPGERAALKAVLAGIWETCEHRRWQEYSFSPLTHDDIRQLIAIAEDMEHRHLPLRNARSEIETILLANGGGRRPR